MSSLKIKRIELESKKSKTIKKTKKNSVQYYKKDFIYINEKNKQITNKSTLDHIKSLKIPPNYNNVLISNDKNSNLQAIGFDSQNRKQYIYHPEFIAANAQIKYEKYTILGKYLKKIQYDVDTIINKIYKLPYNKWQQPSSNIALILYLLDKCLFRIGNYKYYDKYGTIGILTLCEEHITLNQSKKIVNISFIGKKGVLNQCNLIDNKLFIIFKHLKMIKHNKPNEFLFDYKSNNYVLSITIDDIQKVLNNYHPEITPKMFRTWHSNCCFIYLLKNKLDMLQSLENRNQLTKKIKTQMLKEACVLISKRLHNTPNVLKKSYLDHMLFDMFLNNTKKLLKLIQKYKNYNNENTLINIENEIRK